MPIKKEPIKSIGMVGFVIMKSSDHFPISTTVDSKVIRQLCIIHLVVRNIKS